MDPRQLDAQRRLKIAAIATIVIVNVILLSFVFLFPLDKKKPNSKNVALSPTPILDTNQPTGGAPTAKNIDIEKCPVVKEGNPLVYKVSPPRNEVILSVLRGNINNITMSNDNKAAIIEFISPKGDQTTLLHPKEEQGLVYDAIDQKDKTLKDLKRGMTLEVSVNCYGNRGNEFRITRLAITGNNRL